MDEDSMQQLISCSVSYRIAVGSQQGRKVFTLLTTSYVRNVYKYYVTYQGLEKSRQARAKALEGQAQ